MGILNKFKAFAKAFKTSFQIALTRAAAMSRAVREGSIKEADIDEFRAKLQGTSLQEEFDAEVERESRAIMQEYADREEAFSIGDPVAKLTGEEFQKIKGQSLKDRVLEHLNKEGKTEVNHPELGVILITPRGLKSSISKGLGKVKSASFAALPDVLEKGEIAHEANDWKGRGYDTAVIAAPVTVGGKEHLMFAVVEKRDANKYYVHETLPLERKADGSFQIPRVLQKKDRVEPSDIYIVAQEFVQRKSKVNQDNGPSFSFGDTRDEISFSIGKDVADRFNSIKPVDSEGEFKLPEGQRLKDYLDNELAGKKVVNKEVGEVEFRKSKFRKLLSRKAFPIKFQAIPHLPAMIERAVVLSNEYVGGGKNRRVLASKFTHIDKEYAARIVLEQTKEGQWYYNHEMSDLEEIKNPSEVHERNPQATRPPKDTRNILENMLGVKKEGGTSFSLSNSAMTDALVGDIAKRIRKPEVRTKFLGDMARRVENLKRDTDKVIRVAGRDVTQKAIVDPKTKGELREEAKKLEENLYKKKSGRLSKSKSLANAREEAKKEAQEWLDKSFREQERDHNPMARVRRSLATLDAILMALPAELRGKVGGYTQLARLNSDEKRLEFLQKRIEKLDGVVEKWLRKEYGGMMKKLLKRAEPKQGEAGKGKRGQAGATVHRLFDELRDVMAMNATEVEGEMSKIENILESGEPLSNSDQNHYEHLAHLVPLFGDWSKADAARMESAVRNGLHVYQEGYMDQLIKTQAKRERREHERGVLARETGKKGTAKERDDKIDVDNSLKSMPEKTMLSLLSFDQILRWTFGKDSKLARRFADMERVAANQKQDVLDQEFDEFADVFTDIADGDVVEGERLRWKMAQKSINVGGGNLERKPNSLDDAAKMAKSIAGETLRNEIDGLEAKVSGNSIRKMKSASAAGKSRDVIAHAHALANIDTLFKKAVRTFSGSDRNNDPNIKEIHRYHVPFIYQGELAIAKLTAKELAHSGQDNLVYSVEVTDVYKKNEVPSVHSISEERRNYNQRWDFEDRLQSRIKEVKQEGGGRYLSEAEAIQATLIWRQEDGRRHMEGRFDDEGNQVSSWAYTQDFIDELEGKLSDEAKQVREYLIDRYSNEYDGINAVHEELYGISLPRHKNYSPVGTPHRVITFENNSQLKGDKFFVIRHVKKLTFKMILFK